MSTPLVSVIVPCYNQGEFITEAVDSVLAQQTQDVEILIVDDGSTDTITRKVLDGARWPRATVFRTENRGLANARNFLIERATGRYLCALDADDRLHPQYLASTLTQFDREPDLTFVSSRLQMFGDEQRVTPETLECDLRTLLCDCPLFSATLVRRDAVLAVGGYDTHIPGTEDWDLWISLLERGHRGLILPDVLFYYRRRRGSLCDVCTRGEIRINHFRYLVQKHRDSYRAHLDHVLAEKARSIAERQQTIDALEREVEARLSAVHTRQRGVAPFQHDADLAAEVAALRREYELAVAEIDALRHSISWQVTAPLRVAYDRLTRRTQQRPVGATPDVSTMVTGTGRPHATRPPSLDAPESGTDVDAMLLAQEAILLRQIERQERLQEEAQVLQRRLDALGPAGDTPVHFGHLRRTSPISAVWGIDRGRPIDRYYIAAFLERHRLDLKGHVLEVKDAGYTRMFGEQRILASDVLDIDANNPEATIIADLAGADGIGRARYDCFILTQTLGLIYDVRAAIANAAAALKPGGVLLCTLPASGRISYEPPGLEGDYWRFTAASTARLFADVFPADATTITGYGNVLACAAFLYGLADHELSKEELDATDPYFPVIYGVRAVRTWR